MSSFEAIWAQNLVPWIFPERFGPELSENMYFAILPMPRLRSSICIYHPHRPKFWKMIWYLTPTTIKMLDFEEQILSQFLSRTLPILFHPKYTHTIWISTLSSQNLLRYSDFVNSEVWLKYFWTQYQDQNHKIAVSSLLLGTEHRNSNCMCVFWMEQDRQCPGTRTVIFALQNQSFWLWSGYDLISFFRIWAYGNDKYK